MIESVFKTRLGLGLSFSVSYCQHWCSWPREGAFQVFAEGKETLLSVRVKGETWPPFVGYI